MICIPGLGLHIGWIKRKCRRQYTIVFQLSNHVTLTVWRTMPHWQTRVNGTSGTLGLSSSARDCQISSYLRLHQPKVAISRIFGWDNHPKISWASLQNILLIWQTIPLFVQCVLTSPKTRTMRASWAKYLELISRARVSRADEDVICNFRIISQIRNNGPFGHLELMRTGLMGFQAHCELHCPIFVWLLLLEVCKSTGYTMQQSHCPRHVRSLRAWDGKFTQLYVYMYM